MRDHKGRLASDMAFQFGDDPALARLLSIKESKQASMEGTFLSFRPQPNVDLIAAAEDNNMIGVKRAIKNGADVNHQSIYNWITALHFAAGNGNKEMVEYLLGKDADAMRTDKWGRTAAVVAIECGYFDLADRLTDVECRLIQEEKRKIFENRPV